MKILIFVFIGFLFTNSYGQEVNLVKKNIAETNKAKRYEIAIEYPQIDNPENNAQTIINQRIKMFADTLAGDFKKDMADWENPEDTSFSSSFEMGYNIISSADNILSVDFGSYYYYAGAAHPNTYTYTMNFDMLTGNPIELSDIFIPGSSYLNLISDYSKNDLIRQGSENDLPADAFWAEGYAPTADNFRAFTLNKDSLFITFNTYQVTAYALGSWRVGIPFSDLSAVINKEGILRRYK